MGCKYVWSQLIMYVLVMLLSLDSARVGQISAWYDYVAFVRLMTSKMRWKMRDTLLSLNTITRDEWTNESMNYVTSSTTFDSFYFIFFWPLLIPLVVCRANSTTAQGGICTLSHIILVTNEAVRCLENFFALDYTESICHAPGFAIITIMTKQINS